MKGALAELLFEFLERIILVLAKVTLRGKGADVAADVELAGWIGKQTFLAKAKTAAGGGSLVAGTRFMHAEALSEMADLFRLTGIAHRFLTSLRSKRYLNHSDHSDHGDSPDAAAAIF